MCLRCIAVLLLLTCCEDIIEVEKPRTQLVKDTVFEDDLTATAAVSGLYAGLASNAGGFGSVTYFAALSSDDLEMSGSGDAFEFFQNEILATNPNIRMLWNTSYSEIYKANLILEGLQEASNVSEPLRDDLLGEALFFRAFHHFYLLNLFGEIPYITTTDYKVNALAHPMSVEDAYTEIILDLAKARTLLFEDYGASHNERVRVNRWAATAMLARVYLYRNQWALAEEQASVVISKTSVYSLTNLADTFLKNSNEAIWQLMPSYQLQYVTEAVVFSVPVYSPGVATMSEGLFNSFEDNDLRLSYWVTSQTTGDFKWHYSNKYRDRPDNATGKEYSSVIRLAEMYLIRAEARAHQAKLVGESSAAGDLNVIRSRAGLPNTAATTKDELLAAIAHERRVEFFNEWGHRWLDLKRTGAATSTLSEVKSSWDETDIWYPIPFTELQLNPNLKQNVGY